MRCDMEKLISVINNAKLKNETELTFALKGKLPDCKRINTKDYIKVIDGSNVAVETTLAYNRFDRPANIFECGYDNACVNTGLLTLGAATNYPVFKLPYDSSKFANGIVTFFVKGFTGSKTVTFKISGAADFANADVYTKLAKGVAGEFTPVVIDLSATPDSTVGNGWAGTGMSYIAINIADAAAGISSIAIFDSISDFEKNDVVKMRCLTTLDGDDAIDAAEATCADPVAGYDTTSPTFERTFTGTAMSENFRSLNPLVGKGTATKAFDIWSQSFTPVAEGGYAVVVLPDAYIKECGYIMVQAECELLKRYDIPDYVAVDEEHYFVTVDTNGLAVIHMHQNLVGKEVTISYPREATVKEQIADIDNVGKVKVEVYVPYQLSNGKKQAKVYKNVLVTNFSEPRGTDENELSITVSIQKDAEGHYYHIYDYE